MLLHVLTMNDMRTLDNIVGWPLTETSEGGGSQPIRAQLVWRLTNQRPLPDLGDKEQPHLVTRAPHSSGFRHLEFRSDKEPCSGGERTWNGGMSYETCEGSLHSWSDLSWPVAIVTPSAPRRHSIVVTLMMQWVTSLTWTRGEIMELGTCLSQLPHVYTGVNWPHTDPHNTHRCCLDCCLE